MLKNISNSPNFSALDIYLPRNCKGHKRLLKISEIVGNKTANSPNISTMDLYCGRDNIMLTNFNHNKNIVSQVTIEKNDFYKLFNSDDNNVADRFIKLHENITRAENKYKLLVDFYKNFYETDFVNMVDSFSSSLNQLRNMFNSSNKNDDVFKKTRFINFHE